MDGLLKNSEWHDGGRKRTLAGRVEDWRGIPKVKPICLLPVSSGSASLAEP